MKELPIGRQVFQEFIEQDLLYVDKTEHLWNLVRQGKYYFFSRPRRFGKSLLLSTLRSFFEGREDLFRGLYIHDKVKEWKQYPVVHIDYSLITYLKNVETFESSLLDYLEKIAKEHDIELRTSIVQDAMTYLVQGLHKKYKTEVVVLIDEYDKPLVDLLTNETRFNENRNILRGLYGSLKGLDPYLRFVMLTGVSRFAKVGIFSGLNNLEDISMDRRFATMTGFTQEELEVNFELHLKAFQTQFEVKWDDLMANYKWWYNGYSWDGITTLYNPFSILKNLQEQEFGNYWFSTGTPTFLIDLIHSQKRLPETLEKIKTSDLIGGSINQIDFPLIPLLFQTGYLTIKRVERDGFLRRFILDYPNQEVRQSFLRYIAATFIAKDEFDVQPEALDLRDALIEERTDDFVTRLQSFLADIPARLHLPKEAYFHSLVYVMLRLVGIQLLLEKETSKGRIDAVLELSDKVYIIEFKFAQNKRIKDVKTLSRQALAQIDTKEYYETYLSSNKKIILFGLGYLDKKLHGRTKILNQN